MSNVNIAANRSTKQEQFIHTVFEAFSDLFSLCKLALAMIQDCKSYNFAEVGKLDDGLSHFTKKDNDGER